MHCEDLPGFGVRDQQASPRSIGKIAEHVADAVFQHGPQVKLLGLSMGGMVALELARRWPMQCHSLVLVNSSFKPYAPLIHRLRPRAYARVVKALLHPSEQASEAQILSLSSRAHANNADILQAWTQLRKQQPPSRLAVLNQFIAAGRFTYRGARPIDRVLLLASEQDQLVNVQCSQGIAQAWHADLKLHPEAGHDLALDAPHWLASTIAHWQQTQSCN